MRLKIGEIRYANLFPVFHVLRERFDCSLYDFFPGVPSDLNRMLRNGGLDVSPSSSVEYLFNPGLYDYLPGFSISSAGSVRSILLFSRCRLRELNGKKVAVTWHSETSVLLLRVILEHFERITPRSYIRSEQPLESSLETADAYMLIGDAALKESTTRKDSFCYDLGALWWAKTGLPFVYALWTVRRDLPEKLRGLVSALSRQIQEAAYLARFEYPAIARAAPQIEWMRERDLVQYWENLSFDLTDRHVESMDEFRKLSVALNEMKIG